MSWKHVGIGKALLNNHNHKKKNNLYRAHSFVSITVHYNTSLSTKKKGRYKQEKIYNKKLN